MSKHQYVFFIYKGLNLGWALNYLPHTEYKFGADIAMEWDQIDGLLTFET